MYFNFLMDDEIIHQKVPILQVASKDAPGRNCNFLQLTFGEVQKPPSHMRHL